MLEIFENVVVVYDDLVNDLDFCIFVCKLQCFGDVKNVFKMSFLIIFIFDIFIYLLFVSFGVNFILIDGFFRFKLFFIDWDKWGI